MRVQPNPKEMIKRRYESVKYATLYPVYKGRALNIGSFL
jgi:hypothetical protein